MAWPCSPSADTARAHASATTSGGRAALRWFANSQWTVDAAAIFQSLDVDGFGDRDFDRGHEEREGEQRGSSRTTRPRESSLQPRARVCVSAPHR